MILYDCMTGYKPARFSPRIAGFDGSNIALHGSGDVKRWRHDQIDLVRDQLYLDYPDFEQECIADATAEENSKKSRAELEREGIKLVNKGCNADDRLIQMLRVYPGSIVITNDRFRGKKLTADELSRVIRYSITGNNVTFHPDLRQAVERLDALEDGMDG
jgi:hypothetical protein